MPELLHSNVAIGDETYRFVTGRRHTLTDSASPRSTRVTSVRLPRLTYDMLVIVRAWQINKEKQKPYR